MSTARPVSCSQCGLPTYVRGVIADVKCEMCDHVANWKDFELEPGEFLEFDDSDEGDGYLYVDCV